MAFWNWFYSMPLLNVEWGASEAGAVLGSMLTLRSRSPRDVRRLEERVKELTGASGAIAFERGRSALRWILECAARLPGAGGRREVLLPALLCKSVVEAVRAAGLEPVLCDVDDRLAMDMAGAAEIFDPEKTLAIIVPHIYGWPSPVKEAFELAGRNGAVVVDDAAASLGATEGGAPLGLGGHAGIYSFSQGKAACAGGGGMLVLPVSGPFSGGEREGWLPVQPPSRRKARLLFRRFVWHDVLHRFSEPLERVASIGRARLGIGPGRKRALEIELRSMAGLQAAAALAQLRRLDAMAEGRRRNMRLLAEELSGLEEIRVVPMPAEVSPTRFAVETRDLRVRRDASGIREENPLAAYLRGQGIEARYAYLPLNAYEDGAGFRSSRLDVSGRLGDRLLLLPFRPPLGPGEMARIGRAVRQYFGR